MPAPLPLPLRRLLLRRSQQGQDAATIAHALKLRPRTVRHLLQRFAQQPNDLRPSYRPGPGRSAKQQPVYDLAWTLRQEHPTWGAGYIRLHLAETFATTDLPSERALQRWFRQHQQPPAPPGCRPTTAVASPRARSPHDCWQMDAVEQLRLQNGEGVCWLRLVDECSGAFLDTSVFSPVLLGPRFCHARPAAAA